MKNRDTMAIGAMKNRDTMAIGASCARHLPFEGGGRGRRGATPLMPKEGRLHEPAAVVDLSSLTDSPPTMPLSL